MKTTTKPSAIRPGDFIHVTVPKNRLIEPGIYKCRVDSVSARHRHDRGQSYHVSFPLTENHVPLFQDTAEDEGIAPRIHLRLTVYDHPRLHGQAFLGLDEFPVEFSHEQNLELRLRDSIVPKSGKDRSIGDT